MYDIYGIMPVGHLNFECPTGGNPGCKYGSGQPENTYRKVVQYGIFSHNNQRGFLF